MSSKKIDLSIVIPMFNEEEVVEELHDKLSNSLKSIKGKYQSQIEIIFVNDGSTDNTLDNLLRVKGKDKNVKVVNLMGNFGQTAALSAGFDMAKGEIIVSMDGDLQDDPDDIPVLIKKMDEGYDIVSGWRKERKENLIIRRIPSMVANRLLARISGVNIHDFGATMKAYRAEIVKNIRLYGDFHRFIPALAVDMRAKVGEVVIKNHERPYGVSKYGIKRTFTVFFDLFRLRFLLGYLNKPLQTFGTMGVLLTLLGSVFFVYVFIKKFLLGIHIMVEHGPMFITSIALILSGMNLFVIGLLGEMMLRILYESKEKKTYLIRKIYD